MNIKINNDNDNDEMNKNNDEMVQHMLIMLMIYQSIDIFIIMILSEIYYSWCNSSKFNISDSMTTWIFC